jgi:hypothetical protein
LAMFPKILHKILLRDLRLDTGNIWYRYCSATKDGFSCNVPVRHVFHTLVRLSDPELDPHSMAAWNRFRIPTNFLRPLYTVQRRF